VSESRLLISSSKEEEEVYRPRDLDHPVFMQFDSHIIALTVGLVAAAGENATLN
jgi:hypothetical protein